MGTAFKYKYAKPKFLKSRNSREFFKICRCDTLRNSESSTFSNKILTEDEISRRKNSIVRNNVQMIVMAALIEATWRQF